MTEKSPYVADHFPCIFVVFMRWRACFQGRALMFTQEFFDDTDFLSWQRKSIWHLRTQSLRNHMVSQKMVTEAEMGVKAP
jgi:hypothetical protein